MVSVVDISDPTIRSVEKGISASTTQSQGQQTLTATVNEVSTVTNDNDVVTLDQARPGLIRIIINDGNKILQIFPSLGDNLGAGVDQSTSIEINEVIQFVAYDSTNWSTAATTQVTHAEMTDNDNTDAFEVTTQNVHEAYHSNGFVVGDLGGGWTFDPGGAGTAITIDSIADGAAPGVDIAVTCASAHGLVAGDIISQSTGTAAYEGFFKVKAKISDTVYEVAAVFGSTATGVMNQAAVLVCPTGGTGTYLCTWGLDGSAATNNHIFDFGLHQDATHQDKSNGRLRFGGAAEVTAIGRPCLLDIVEGEKIGFGVKNTSGTGNITIRHINVVLIRL